MGLRAPQAWKMAWMYFREDADQLVGMIDADYMSAGKTFSFLSGSCMAHWLALRYEEVLESRDKGDGVHFTLQNQPDIMVPEDGNGLPTRAKCKATVPGLPGCPCIEKSIARKAVPTPGVQLAIVPATLRKNIITKVDKVIQPDSPLCWRMQSEDAKLGMDLEDLGGESTDRQKKMFCKLDAADLKEIKIKVPQQYYQNGQLLEQHKGWAKHPNPGLSKYVIVSSQEELSMLTDNDTVRNKDMKSVAMVTLCGEAKWTTEGYPPGKKKIEANLERTVHTKLVHGCFPVCKAFVDEFHKSAKAKSGTIRFLKTLANKRAYTRVEITAASGTPWENGMHAIQPMVETIMQISQTDETGVEKPERNLTNNVELLNLVRFEQRIKKFKDMTSEYKKKLGVREKMKEKAKKNEDNTAAKLAVVKAKDEVKVALGQLEKSLSKIQEGLTHLVIKRVPETEWFDARKCFLLPNMVKEQRQVDNPEIIVNAINDHQEKLTQAGVECGREMKRLAKEIAKVEAMEDVDENHLNALKSSLNSKQAEHRRNLQQGRLLEQAAHLPALVMDQTLVSDMERVIAAQLGLKSYELAWTVEELERLGCDDIASTSDVYGQFLLRLLAGSQKANDLSSLSLQKLREGHNVVVMCFSPVTANIIARKLREDLMQDGSGFRLDYMRSKTKKVDEQAMLQRFQDPDSGRAVLISSYNKLGVGIDLQAAHTLLHLGFITDLSMEVQSNSRVYRSDNTSDPDYNILVATFWDSRLEIEKSLRARSDYKKMVSDLLMKRKEEGDAGSVPLSGAAA